MKEMPEKKDVPYDLRDSHILYQEICKKITYGKKTFKYYGSHILYWTGMNYLYLCASSINLEPISISTWDKGAIIKCTPPYIMLY